MCPGARKSQRESLHKKIIRSASAGGGKVLFSEIFVPQVSVRLKPSFRRMYSIKAQTSNILYLCTVLFEDNDDGREQPA